MPTHFIDEEYGRTYTFVWGESTLDPENNVVVYMHEYGYPGGFGEDDLPYADAVKAYGPLIPAFDRFDVACVYAETVLDPFSDAESLSEEELRAVATKIADARLAIPASR